MKNLKKIRSPFKKTMLFFLLSVLLCGIPLSGNAQEKSIADLKKAAETAKKAAETEIKKNNYDCETITNAIKAAEDAHKEITERKKNMTPPKDNKDQSKEAKAYREAEAAEKSAAAHAAAARKCAHGLATSDEIEAELGKMKDKIDNGRKLPEDVKRKLKELIDELITAAQDAAKTNPCDPSAVRDAVNDKLKDQYEENRQEEDRPTRDLIQQWFEDNFRLDDSGTGKKPRIEQDGKRKKRPFTHISVQPSTPQGQAIYFTVAPFAGYPLSSPDAKTMEFNALQEAVFAPDVFPQLFERLQGEFVIGNPPGTQNPPLTLEGSSQITPGIRLGLGFGRRMEVQTGVQYFRAKWSGYFPVTVFSHEGTQPQVIQGNLHAAASGFLAEADVAYFLSKGTFQPFVKAGARAHIPTQNSSSGDITGVSIPVEMPGLERSIAPFGGLGARLGLGASGYADFSGTYGKIPGGGYAPAMELSLGFKFGGKRKDSSPLPPTVKYGQSIDDALLDGLKVERNGDWYVVSVSMGLNPGSEPATLQPELLLSIDGTLTGRYLLGDHGISSGICCSSSTDCEKIEGFRVECMGACPDNSSLPECVYFKDKSIVVPARDGNTLRAELVFPSGFHEVADPLRKNNSQIVSIRPFNSDQGAQWIRVPVDCPTQSASYTVEVCADNADQAVNKAKTQCRGKYVCNDSCTLSVSAKSGDSKGTCEENGKKGNLYPVTVTFSCER